MKRRLTAVMLIGLILWGCLPVRAGAECSVSADCAVLIEAKTGRVLYEKAAHRRMLIASTTKLMTALVVLESGHPMDEKVEILPDYTGAEGSSLYLKAGERLTIETLLYGLLLHSGNDAAQALALFCAGSTEKFAEQMNRKAGQLEMRDSHFANPSGLDQEGHYSTAYDMALLARACLKNETLKKIVSTRSVHMEGRSFVNHNKLLWQYPGCVGLKTGYTQQAGRTLVSAAERDGTTLIAVTLRAPDDWKDHRTLLDWGFQHCQVVQLAVAGERIALVPVEGSLLPMTWVRAADDLFAAVLSEEKLSRRIELEHQRISAPIRSGERAGQLICLLDGQLAGKTMLVFEGAADCRVPRTGPMVHLWKWFRQE